MAHQPNPMLGGAILRGARLAISTRLLATVVLIAWAGSQCQAQQFTYPQSYSVPSSYPAWSDNTRPTAAPKTYPRNVGASAASTPAVNRAPSVRFTNTSPSTFRSQQIIRDGSTTTPRTISRGDVPRLASINRLSSQPRFPLTDSLASQRSDDKPVSLYDARMIQSARQSAVQFERIANSSPTIAAKIANENANFAEQWADLAETQVALNDRIQDATTKLNTTTRDFEDATAKLTKYGLTPTVGLLLRHKKEQLDSWQVNDSQTLFASQELQRSRQLQLELEMVRHDGADAAAQSAEILADAGYDSKSFQHAPLASQVQDLLRQRHQWFVLLQRGYQEYQQKLGELDSAVTASAKLTSDYRKLIDRHITWIRSGDPLSVRDARNLQGGMAALFDSRRSEDFGPTLDRKLKSNAVGGIGLLGWIILVFVARLRAKSWLVGIGRGKRMRDATANARKLVAGVLTVLVALAFPSILYAVARWLGTGIVSESTLHASGAFYAASLVGLVVELPRQLLCTFGYLDKHVDIKLPGLERASKYLTLVGFSLVLAAYAITLMGSIDHGIWRGSVARFGFMGAMLLVAWTAHRSLRPTGGFLEPWIAKFGGNVIHRIRFLIYLAGLGFPLAMLALSALGYGFTANELTKRAIITLVALFIAATLWGGVKILSAHAWQMLTGAPRPPRQFDEYGEIKTEAAPGVLAENYLELKHQLAFLCQCALVVGAIVSFGWLWIDIFPNARMGNPVVWTVQDTVTQSSVDAAGKTITRSVVETTPVTAMHLALAAATLFVAFQLAKLLPALFDALVLQRVSFDEGMEHFSLVLGRFLLFGVGCFIACRWVGIRWQAIQWLAVGLTIGLGFGLHDIVRNLFGGMIVLFEKPARLGDLITVGKVTGRVAAQKLRTTVLSDEDGREVIIPNKNFVSEDVVNWMGAGRLRVIPIEVAVKRDERPADICRTLQELVLEQQDILLTPAPQATLVCVAKRSQRIEVRAWIEEGQDTDIFRDSLLKVVTKFLREKELLAARQPSQPTIPAPVDPDSDVDDRSRTSSARRRSA